MGPGPEAADPLSQRVAEVLARAVEEGAAGAYQELRSELAEHPDDPVLQCGLGVLARQAGADGVAYEHFRRCLAAEPADPTLLATAGNALAGFDDPEAESALRLAALTAPDLPLARLCYGAYLAREGQLELSVRELEAAVRLAPDDRAAWLELGTAYLLAERGDAGVEALERAADGAPEGGWEVALHAMVAWERGGEEVLDGLARSAAARPRDVELQLFCALALAATGREEEAWDPIGRVEAVAGEVEPGLVDEVVDRVAEGGESAADFLRQELAPRTIRDRLLQRG